MSLGLKPIPKPTSLQTLDHVLNFRAMWENVKKLISAFQPMYYTTQHSNFSLLLTLIGTTSATIYVNSAVSITANTTIPSNISIVILKGGSFAISTGVTLTFNGPFDASGSPTFEFFTGAGTYVFGSSVRMLGGAALVAQGTMHRMTIVANLTIPADWCSQMVNPVVETGVLVTVDAGGLWFVDT